MVMRETSRADTMPEVRLLLYNIRYATGTGPAFHLPVPGAGYLRSNPQVLSEITEFIKRQDPDVVGLIEVDTGSIRTGMVNRARVSAAPRALKPPSNASTAYLH